MLDRLAQWLAGRLPEKVAYWAWVRVSADIQLISRNSPKGKKS